MSQGIHSQSKGAIVAGLPLFGERGERLTSMRGVIDLTEEGVEREMSRLLRANQFERVSGNELRGGVDLNEKVRVAHSRIEGGGNTRYTNEWRSSQGFASSFVNLDSRLYSILSLSSCPVTLYCCYKQPDAAWNHQAPESGSTTSPFAAHSKGVRPD